MPADHPLLARVLADPLGQAWAILAREGQECAEVLVGNVIGVDLLGQIPSYS
jgi:phenazine biosynthesis protein phzE